MRTTITTGLLISGLVVSICFRGGAQTVNFTDGTFNDADWGATKIDDTTSGQGATYSAAQNLTDGDPGACREVDFSYSVNGTGGSQGEVVANVFGPSAYFPATQGPIRSLSYSFVLIVNSEPYNGPGLLFGLVVLQDGKFFLHLSTNNSLAGGYRNWNPWAETNLQSTNFQQIGTDTYPGPITFQSIFPDFSSSGSRIQFGYFLVSAGGIGSPADEAFVVAIDNFSTTLFVLPRPVFTDTSASGGVFSSTLTNVVPGETIIVAASTNLVDWVPIQTNAVTGATLLFTNNINSAIPAQFFRAVGN
jgi:hypothetical protein